MVNKMEEITTHQLSEILAKLRKIHREVRIIRNAYYPTITFSSNDRCLGTYEKLDNGNWIRLY